MQFGDIEVRKYTDSVGISIAAAGGASDDQLRKHVVR